VDLLLNLIDLGVNNVVSDGGDGPLLDFLILQVEQSCEFLEAELSLLLQVDTANSQELLFLSQGGGLYLVLLKQFLVVLEFGVELFDVGTDDEFDQLEDLLRSGFQILDCVEQEDFFDVDGLGRSKGSEHQLFGLRLPVSFFGSNKVE
jgi:hypothetical protein